MIAIFRTRLMTMMLAAFVAGGGLPVLLSAQSNPPTPKPAKASDTQTAFDQLGTERTKALQKGVFRGLSAVSVRAEIEENTATKQPKEVSEKIEALMRKRLEGMGLKIVEDEGKFFTRFDHPMIELSTKLTRLPDSKLYVGYDMELVVLEMVNLKRAPSGSPIAKTYTFSGTGYFMRADLSEELLKRSSQLLDLMDDAVRTAKSEPASAK